MLHKYSIRYSTISDEDEKFKVQIEAIDLNNALLKFATFYHEIKEVYSIKKV